MLTIDFIVEGIDEYDYITISEVAVVFNYSK